MREHVVDEGRHSKYTRRCCRTSGKLCREKECSALAAQLPTFFNGYVSARGDGTFDRGLLTDLAMLERDVDEVLRDTAACIDLRLLNKADRRIVQMVRLLKKAGVWHEAGAALTALGLGDGS